MFTRIYTTPCRGRLWHRPDNSRVIINSLLYADDVVLFGSAGDMTALLEIAELHARSPGYRWALVSGEMCNYRLSPQPLSYRLYGEFIPQLSTFTYLRLPFTD
ncbi:hypothetical protein VTP01DRAFT_1960 [Rhizomucor pusillus]|uniref:uncharacterized protein n=1 Tax=Rhizomucor pusillus TaxID=4840 RepID=UPI003743C38D